LLGLALDERLVCCSVSGTKDAETHDPSLIYKDGIMSITKKIVRAGIQALAIGALLLGMAARGSATTLNFDSIPTPKCNALAAAIDPITAGYGGFTWDGNLAVECDTDYKGPSSTFFNSYGAPSSSNAIYNQAGTLSVTIKRGTLFDFDGATVYGWTLSDLVDLPDQITAQSITIKGWSGGVGGTLRGSETITLDGADTTAGLGYKAAGSISGDIDTLQITTPAINGTYGNFWLLDDFQYHDAGTTTVPEPASALLLGSGIVGLLALRRRKIASTSR
jgi:hypothetical protein